MKQSTNPNFECLYRKGFSRSGSSVISLGAPCFLLTMQR